MSLSGSGLSSAIKAAIEAQSLFGIPVNDAELQEFCDAIGNAVVDYLKANTVVNATGPDPQGGVVVSVGTIS